MAKEFSVGEWQDRICNGMRFQEKFGKSKEWKRYKEYYRHEFKGKDIIPVNLVFSLLRSLVPQVYFRNPSVTVTSSKPGMEAELNARIVQHLDNWLLGELMVKTEIKKMIADSFLTGNGTGFIGYDSTFGLDPQQMATDSLSFTQFDKKGYRLEYNANVNPGMPWFLRVRPEDVIWPWGCESPTNAEWVAMRVFRPLEDVKADPKYTNTADLTGSFVQGRSGAEQGQTIDIWGLEETKERQWVELFQIHDARTGKIYALTMNYNKFLRNQPDELQIDGLPVEILSFNSDPDYIYGVPDARLVEPQLLELNEIRTQAMRHRRIDILKAIVKKGIFKDLNLSKLTDENVMAIVEADVDTNLRDSIMTFTPGASGILSDLAASGEIVRGDVREMVGFSRIAQGEFQGKTHISATETKAVFQSLNIRLDERRDMIADLLTRVIRKFNQIVFTKWDMARVSQIVGPDGAKYWMKYTGQALKDEYDLKITPEEGPSLDTGTKFEMGLKAAEVWATLNQGLVKSGAPIPNEIQRLIFTQLESSGLDIDKLLAQSQASSKQAQMMSGMMGQSPDQAVSPKLLATAMQ